MLELLFVLGDQIDLYIPFLGDLSQDIRNLYLEARNCCCHADSQHLGLLPETDGITELSSA